MTIQLNAKEVLEQKLRQHEGTSHLRVTKRGDSLSILSGEPGDTLKHARLTHLGAKHWGLSLPTHNGRWEPTPFTGTMDELLETLLTDFSFYLEKL
jgi:hypothetical protein